VILRPYQKDAYENTLKVFERASSALLVLSTGTGKTIIFSHIVKRFANLGRVLVLAHREELILQAKEKIKLVSGIDADVEMGQDWAPGGWAKSEVIVSSIQTQCAGREGGRMTRFEPTEFSLLVIDEAHHSASATYRRVVKYYMDGNPDLKLLGVTATPDRLDEKALGQTCKEVAFVYGIEDAISDGWLVPIEQRSVFVSGLDYSAVKTTAGDLNGKDLAAILEYEENIHAIASPTIELTGDKKTLIFAASVGQAERLTEIINRHKPGQARFVYGKTPRDLRRDMFADFAVKRFQYLVNVGVATEGFDDPGIECVVMARPTKSRALFTQCVGRGTRPLPGLVDQFDDAIERRDAIFKSAKPAVEIIDFVGNAGKHKLVTAADILGGKYDDEVVVLAGENAAKESAATGKPADIATELQKAEHEIAKRNSMAEEAAYRDKVKLRAHFSTAKVNPFNVLDMDPRREMPWHKGQPPTQKQLGFLKNKGVDTDGMTLTHAKQMIDTLYKRQQTGKATFKQTKCVQKFGYDTSEMSFKEAGDLITRLVANKWKKVPLKPVEAVKVERDSIKDVDVPW